MINHPQFMEQEGDGTFYVEGDEYVAETNIKRGRGRVRVMGMGKIEILPI